MRLASESGFGVVWDRCFCFRLLYGLLCYMDLFCLLLFCCGCACPLLVLRIGAVMAPSKDVGKVGCWVGYWVWCFVPISICLLSDWLRCRRNP